MKFKRLLSSVLCLIMLVGTLTVPTFAAELKSFKDVPADFWAHDYIMAMVDKGMFAGTTAPDKNGVGTFSPNTPMTRAAFITVVTRYLYADELNAMGAGEKWYSNFYNIALEKELIRKNYLPESGLGEAMTRQEMAYVLANALEELGQTPEQVIPDSRIPDYSSIGTAYRKYVKVAYTEGLIAGTDTKGTFNPMGTLTRAQAATVIYRLVEESTRNPINVSESIVQEQESVNIGQDKGANENTGVQIWVEGEKHDIPKEGDIIITADGVEHTITRDPISGVLGAGLDIYYDIWTGYPGMGKRAVDMNGRVTYGYVTGPGGMIGYDGGIIGRDSTSLLEDPITGQIHTGFEWSRISSGYYLTSSTKGSYEGEIRNNWFKWEDGGWTWIGPVG